MQLKSILFNVALSSFLSAASADCQLGNKIIDTDKFNKHQDDEKLCLSQGEGDWTFSMELSAVNFPSFDADNPFAGFVANQGFAIYDNTCALKGSYDPHQDNSCGIPYVIMESFLTQVLTVTSVNFDVGAGSFSFNYGDGKYVINNNGCDCVDDSGSGLRAVVKCKCAFPVDGTFDGKRRGLEFKA